MAADRLDDDTLIPFPWIRARVVADEVGVQVVCERCGTSRLLDPTLSEQNLRRESHDFVIRHRHCRERVLQ